MQIHYIIESFVRKDEKSIEQKMKEKCHMLPNRFCSVFAINILNRISYGEAKQRRLNIVHTGINFLYKV
jgi:hypothetical protein